MTLMDCFSISGSRIPWLISHWQRFLLSFCSIPCYHYTSQAHHFSSGEWPICLPPPYGFTVPTEIRKPISVSVFPTVSREQPLHPFHNMPELQSQYMSQSPSEWGISWTCRRNTLIGLSKAITPISQYFLYIILYHFSTLLLWNISDISSSSVSPG